MVDDMRDDGTTRRQTKRGFWGKPFGADEIRVQEVTSFEEDVSWEDVRVEEDLLDASDEEARGEEMAHELEPEPEPMLENDPEPEPSPELLVGEVEVEIDEDEEPAPEEEPAGEEPVPEEEPAGEEPAHDEEPAGEELTQMAEAPQPTLPQEPQRLYVDGDYRLEPENRAAYDDPSLADVGFTAESRVDSPHDGQTVTSFLSGPPVGLSKRGRRIRILAVVIPVVLVILVLYGLGVRRFSARYAPNTSIHACDVSGKTKDEALQALDSQTKTYACAVSAGDFGMTVTGSDIGLTRDASSLVDATWGTQNPYLWPIEVFSHTTLTPDNNVKFDEDTLSSLVDRAVDSYNDRTLPSDGVSIAFNEGAGAYELKGEVKGSAVDQKAIESSILESVRAMQTDCNPDAGNVFRGAKPSDLPDYRDAVEHANAARNSNIDALVDGNVVATSLAEEHAGWVSITNGPKVVIDQDGVRAWAESAVADAAYHTDDWNVYILDTDAFVEGLSDRLAHGNVDGYEVPLIDERTREGESRDKAYEHSSWNKEMGRYIDVDLESQFARLFDEKGEVLWESAFVSGDMMEGHSTVEGLFNIYSKELGTVLVGLDYNGDGDPDYQSYVNYWMPFYGGYGLHDATWRWTFGGDLYQYDGSHGCVNLPYEKAKELFGITFVGEVVYVHW